MRRIKYLIATLALALSLSITTTAGEIQMPTGAQSSPSNGEIQAPTGSSSPSPTAGDIQGPTTGAALSTTVNGHDDVSIVETLILELLFALL